MTNFQLDETDQKILKLLIENARMPYLEIARECGVSGAAIHQRVKKMENNGIILGSRLLVDPKALGLNICAFIAVQLKASHYHEVIDVLKKMPEIIECHMITGEYTLLLKIYCKRDENLMKLLIDTIQGIPEVTKTETWISLDQSFNRQIRIGSITYEPVDIESLRQR